jgi:hypothetical protein
MLGELALIVPMRGSLVEPTPGHFATAEISTKCARIVKFSGPRETTFRSNLVGATESFSVGFFAPTPPRIGRIYIYLITFIY